ncbi:MULTISPECIES: RraA family protein [unclassified Paenibacillus]|uniref:RraA family protein n=1 Tax=unclassified Paenibacillus TaxID=185978 RepID=UPI0008991BBC|nr:MULTISPECIES: S-adenosylmethionine--2-demethylmenaquinone methyltransferase [unclassified Paenibacillus]OMC72235.1 S-adenosylmethionine--2-demethylmenaquinone methyltransferase [Paenibacillus sp. FSL H7-0326]SDX44471.1 Regulator of RNase E activity RraA [Paenibacillus sp. PDC88]
MNAVHILPNDLMDRAKKLNSSLLADVMGGTGAMDHQIKPVAKDMNVVGTAYTVSLRPGDNLFLHQAIYSAKEGDVLIVDGKDYKSHAYLGILMASAAKAAGIAGIVIDGLVRDKVDLEELGFPVYSKGFTPNGPFKDGPGDLNQIISCGGVTVTPGDLVIADDDGVVIVPKEEANTLLTLAEEKLAYEKQRLQTIQDYMREGKKDISLIAPAWLESKIKKFQE